ncbi:MAG: acyltransferase [Clostridiales Family XIII bacterium]|jgi:peptidoglycan/LPS O-acetylase OafA/YrhL|nr:acyltransferase [Clostridiales Family XIII bacterium]
MRLTHVKGIDSIRALGVVLVVVYHLFTKLLPAGFFGVDIFFVISGFLVTSLFLQERAKTKRIDLIGFYARRVRRLLPAAAFMVVCTLTLALLISPDLRVGIREQTAAVFGWVTNWFEIAGGQSYEDQFIPHLFVHTWTLGVEMQYYIGWGFAVFLIVALYNHAAKKVFTRRFWMFVIALALAACSYLWMRHMFVGLDEASPAYYATTTRVYPLLIGSALGALTGMRSPRKPPPAALPVCGLAASLVIISYLAWRLSFSDPATYEWGILVVSVLTAFAIWCVLALQSKEWFRDIKPLAVLGKRSYSIYLFHWPLYNIFKQLATVSGGIFTKDLPQPLYAALALAATAVLAEISYRYFEQRPVGGKERRTARRAPMRGFTVFLIVAFVGLCCVSTITLAKVPDRTRVEVDYLRQQTLITITGLDRYGAYLAGLALDPVAIHAMPEQLPPTPTEWAAAEDLGDDAVDTLENAQSAINRPDPAGPVQPIEPPGGGWTNDGQWINVWGDSVTLGAADILNQTLQTALVDAKVSRNIGAGVDLINEWDYMSQLTNYFVVALFTNTQNFTQDETIVFLDAVPQGRRVIFVTPYGKDYMEPTAEFLRGLPSQYPYVTIADWNLAIRDHTDLLASDGMHMESDDAKQIYANTIAQAIDQASKKPAKE